MYVIIQANRISLVITNAMRLKLAWTPSGKTAAKYHAQGVSGHDVTLGSEMFS